MPRASRAPAARPSPFTGKTLGRCTIEGPIGRGATATVFHATYIPLQRAVAVKILKADSTAAPETRAKFVDEARALAKLDHPNVVKVFDVVEDGGYLLIIMDLVGGKNLKQVLDEDGAVDPEEAVGWARQIAEALDHAHGQRILHRDVKPANIVLDDEGRAVLVDFGNAEVVGEAADRKGTALYVAPEVFQGKRQDERTDTYSLGATLFHLVAGEPPHRGENVKEILAATAAGKVRSPSQVNPEAGIPRELDTLVKRSMASARGYRFLAKEMIAALDEVLPVLQGEGKRKRSRRSAGGAGGRSRAPAKSAGPPLALLGVGVLVLAGLAFALFSGGPEKPATAPKAPEPVASKEALPGLPEDTGVVPGAGIDQRAAGREAREAAAAKALQGAADFAAANGTNPKAVAARYAAVASEYAEMGPGMKAREEAKSWGEKALGEGEKSARDAEMAADARREKELRAEAMKRCEEAAGKMQFAEALAALQEADPPASQKDAWLLRKSRLNLLIDFAASIGADLEGNAVAAWKIGSGIGKVGEKVTGAEAEGVTLTGTGGSRRIPWTDLKPTDVLALCRQVMSNKSERRLMLAAYCKEAGLPDEAKKEMDNALLTDRTGTASARLEELFGPEEER